jgi:hypothetical protein
MQVLQVNDMNFKSFKIYYCYNWTHLSQKLHFITQAFDWFLFLRVRSLASRMAQVNSYVLHASEENLSAYKNRVIERHRLAFIGAQNLGCALAVLNHIDQVGNLDGGIKHIGLGSDDLGVPQRRRGRRHQSGTSPHSHRQGGGYRGSGYGMDQRAC